MSNKTKLEIVSKVENPVKVAILEAARVFDKLDNEGEAPNGCVIIMLRQSLSDDDDSYNVNLRVCGMRHSDAIALLEFVKRRIIDDMAGS